MNITDLDLLTTVSTPTLSPDGSLVVVAATRPHVGADAYVGQLWRVGVDGGTPVERLTRGFRDTAPQFSPDGAVIAFLRVAGPGEKPQIHVIHAAGGEPVVVTDQALGVQEFAWAPDSTRLVFVARVPEPGRYGTLDGIGFGAEPARRITTTRYLSNGVGYVIDRRAQLFVVDVPDVTGEPHVTLAPSVNDPKAPEPEDTARTKTSGALPGAVQLTDADADHQHPRFTSDGSAVTFVAALHPHRDTDLRVGAHRVEVGADGTPGATTTIIGPDTDLGVADVVTAPDQTTYVLASALGAEGVDFVGTNTTLYVMDGPGSAPRRLLDPEAADLGVGRLTLADDGTVLVTETTRGTVQLLRVDRTGVVARLTHGPLEVDGVAVRGDVVVAALRDPGSMGDLAVVEPGGLRRLTDFSALLRGAGVIGADELVVTTRDGQQVHGWVLTPDGAEPHPTLLVIHGGPYAQYTGSFFDEAQVYAAAGYGVVMCNPRGAAGYGQTFGRAIQGRMGTVDLTDVLDFLDGALAARPTLDGSRVGIMGGSYGGYLTAWTVAHDHRFAAAIVERGFLDPELFIGTSDIGTYFAQHYTGEDPVTRREQSPQAVVDRVRTPTLIIHSEDDLRCPLSQAQRYHLALVQAGVETEMVVFPGEDHELSRSGRPRHRVQRFDAILDWWSRHLPV